MSNDPHKSHTNSPYSEAADHDLLVEGARRDAVRRDAELVDVASRVRYQTAAAATPLTSAVT